MLEVLQQTSQVSCVASAVSSVVHDAAQFAADAFWPPRCAVCDAIGAVLCDLCRQNLPYIDQWKACPRCGAPWGAIQCSECNSFSLREAGLTTFPLDGCVSAVLFDAATARIATVCKDSGERRLAHDMAFTIACAIPSDWVEGATITFVPSTRAARLRRGFDHAEELASHVACFLGVPLAKTITLEHARDQRGLSRTERLENMRMTMQPCASSVSGRYIIVDDVHTTGATLYAAADILCRKGASAVYGATFARVY